MNPTKKSKHYNTEQAIIYTILAIIVAIIGFMQSNFIILIGAIIVSMCAFYWIWKSWGKTLKTKG